MQLSVSAQKEGYFESVIEFACIAAPLLFQSMPLIIDIINTVIELYKIKQVSNEIDPTRTQYIKDDRVQFFNNSGQGALIVNNNTYNIYNNQTVQDVMASSFNKINKDETVTGFKMSSDEEEVDFDKDEFAAMSKKITIEPQDSEEQTKAATLVVVKPILEKTMVNGHST